MSDNASVSQSSLPIVPFLPHSMTSNPPVEGQCPHAIEGHYRISRFDMSLRRRTGSGQNRYTSTQLKLHKPTMAIGYSLRICARHVDSTNPGRRNLVFRSKPIAEAEMMNRLIGKHVLKLEQWTV